ncbi:MAG: type II toxin-antitoxin system Phd/YefM family antitoxin [Acidobacteria bacterium]|nr:MAG: type II toxin-antitoxin system Phd/YefM family antitoxin [Acidobacteriota bacterium]
MAKRRVQLREDQDSLTAFRRNSAEYLKRLRRTKRPLVLTVNGKVAAVVQDAAEYQRLRDLAAEADVAEGIWQGREDVAQGRVRDAREFFAEFEAEHGLRR